MYSGTLSGCRRWLFFLRGCLRISCPLVFFPFLFSFFPPCSVRYPHYAGCFLALVRSGPRPLVPHCGTGGSPPLHPSGPVWVALHSFRMTCSPFVPTGSVLIFEASANRFRQGTSGSRVWSCASLSSVCPRVHFFSFFCFVISTPVMSISNCSFI